MIISEVFSSKGVYVTLKFAKSREMFFMSFFQAFSFRVVFIFHPVNKVKMTDRTFLFMVPAKSITTELIKHQFLDILLF